MVYHASHSPEAKHVVYTTWKPRVGTHQVEAGGILPRGAYALPSQGGAEGFQREYFYDDWMGPVGFKVEDSNSIPGDLILHAGSG